ncbi:MAG TPA: serine hydrolase [Bacteroidales bacterium]|nr:serine hydrolase [Bacteroidales bacterium]HPF02325.1 serine hydrolase [Bacteroidales bacterium]HPJ58953.1 serine hydrolase [Bacteroidales bacterium]HPR12207.1 serine hydrolase [Bacteroidales bacterium]HRW85859.1 serine hydrolase [Bacteroidales bacterium]
MKHSISSVIFFMFLLQAIYCQTFEWEKALPEEEGFSPEKILALRDTLVRYRTTSILVIRNDRIILEWYAPGWDASRKHYTASLAKSLAGGMSLALALNDGRLKVDDPACRYIDGWKNDPEKSKITIRHLATHSSGIEDAEVTKEDLEYARDHGITIKDKHMDIPGWKGQFWRREPDPFSVSRDKAPVIFEPGTKFHYSNPGMALLAYAVTSSYKGTEYEDIRTLLRRRIFSVIGIKDSEWDIGYGKTYEIDGLKLVANWGGASFTPRAVARTGRLMMNYGNWEGRQLIDTAWVKELTGYAGTPLPPRNAKQPAPACGLGWYNNFDGVWADAPRDLFLGSGAGNQTLIVIPSLKIIIVRNGENMFDENKGEGHYYGVVSYLIKGLMDAFNEAPYPNSPLIRDAKFAPLNTIVRKACDSDNWPLTWAADGYIYAAYGDGTGFEPKTEKKLSLGLARISGGPEDFEGVNIRSATGEKTGDGRRGEKASGMLSVGGTLYMWLRNANRDGGEAKLAWSEDMGVTWKYCEWTFSESFGCPTFLNFGKNYRDARDAYVYIYSNDENTAYKASDRMVMARVPKKKITVREEYEFFKETDSEGNPVWTSAINERGAVFVHPANCYRSGITYNKGLKRYFWCQVHPTSTDSRGPRYQGGFGIYEAPEPWGPWHTVFFTKEWDTGPGETSSLPVKWMSRDGRTCYLVFSGNDCFSVRKVEFVIK